MTTLTLPQTQRCARLEPDQVADAELVLADLDGCLISEGQAFAEATAFVEACAERLWIVSNNSTDTARGLSASLAGLGLKVAPERILLAGEQTLLHLALVSPDSTVSLYANEVLQQEARALGLRVVSNGADRVVLCRDLGFAMADLAEVAAKIEGGAQLWVSNTDGAHPSLDGRPVPETGALLAAVQAVAGPVAFKCIGKPNVHMAQIALARSGVEPRDAVFVGDSAATDGALAKAADMPFLHLLREHSA